MLKSLTIQDVLLFILIVVTYYYARSTDKMRKLIQKQVIPDIKLEVKEFTSFLELVQEPLLKLSLDIYNTNFASGYITKSVLFIEYPNGTNEEIHPDLKPRELRVLYETPGHETISVSGYERQAKTLNYYVKHNSHLSLSKTNRDNAKFYIKFIDCLGNKCTLLLTVKSGEYKS